MIMFVANRKKGDGEFCLIICLNIQIVLLLLFLFVCLHSVNFWLCVGVCGVKKRGVGFMFCLIDNNQVNQLETIEEFSGNANKMFLSLMMIMMVSVELSELCVGDM